jgi:hypothetical protein
MLAGMVIIGHMVIPHDHHLSLMESGLKDFCPVSDDRSGHHPLFPSHCHAFNDLAAEKFTPIIIEQDNQPGLATVIWSPDYVIPLLRLTQTVLPPTDKPFADISIPDLFPFRAPPSNI